MAEGNIGGGAFGTPEEGQAAAAMGNATVNSRLSVDLKMLKGLNDELSKLDGNVKKIKSNFTELITKTKSLTAELKKAADAMGKLGGGAGGTSGYMDTSRGMPPVAGAGGLAALQNAQMEKFGQLLKTLQGGGGIASGGGFGGGGGGRILGGLNAFSNNPYVQIGAQLAGQAIETIDNRVDRNRGYAIGADRLSVQLQQMYGMSQQQVMTQMRQPLRQYRLGVGGINELLALQARSGLTAGGQAGSIEALRALTGYASSTADMVGLTESMASPEVANRMFLMAGTGMYGIGGQQRSALEVFQNMTQRFGLTNQRMVEAGRQRGSNIRQRLAMAGLDESAQDLLLQYASSNVQFRERGGKGMYDPSRDADRRLMGIEENFATQMEETARTTAAREEQMYKRQADNYAQLEENLQKVNKVLGEFEDKLSGIVGARTSTRGFKGLLAPGLAIAGGIIGAFAGGPMGAAAGVSIGSTLGGALGDPGYTGDAAGGANPGRIAQTNATGARKPSYALQTLKPVLREPLERLLNDRPGISVGEGYRSPEKQRTMFLDRYFKTDKKTDTFWQGSYWEKKPGVPAAAPPGLSMHEIGLAADLNFETPADEAWLKANASKYGLEEFSFMGEVWHVQSKAYPRSRRAYEAAGAPFGTTDASDIGYKADTSGITQETSPRGQAGPSANYSALASKAAIIQAMGLADSMAAFANSRTVVGPTGKPNTGGVAGTRDKGNPVSDESGDLNTAGEAGVRKYYQRLRNKLGVNIVGRGEIEAALRKVRVRGRSLTAQEIEGFTKLAYRESKYDRAAFANDSDDISFGLLQLNMLNGANRDMERKFPHLKGNWDKLWDTQTNIDVAAEWLMADGLTSNRGNNIYYHWAGTPDDPTSGKGGYRAKSGDPALFGTSTTGSVGASTNVGKSTSNVITISPTVNINSVGSLGTDLRQMAKEVTKILEREVAMSQMRS